MLGVGEYVDGIIEFPTLQMTQGARFGTNFAPEDVEIVDWGSMSMELGCDAGMVGYASTIASFGAGEQDLARLSHLAGPGCPYEAPRLTDLYNAEWLEMPLPEDGAIDVRRVSDDGTVIGMRALEDRDEGEIVVLPPGSEKWLTLPAQAVLRDGPVLFSRFRAYHRHRGA